MSEAQRVGREIYTIHCRVANGRRTGVGADVERVIKLVAALPDLPGKDRLVGTLGLAALAAGRPERNYILVVQASLREAVQLIKSCLDDWGEFLLD